MTLQTDPPLSLTQIYTEFGAPFGTPLSEFLRGGVWVPDISINIGVPTVLPISILDLLGSSATEPTELIVMTAATNPSSMGEQTGYSFADYGSIDPQLFRGVQFTEINNNSNNDFIRIHMDGLQAQDFWDDLTVVGPNWNEVFQSALADYSFIAGNTQTRWEFDPFVHGDFTIGADYDCTFGFTP